MVGPLLFGGLLTGSSDLGRDSIDTPLLLDGLSLLIGCDLMTIVGLTKSLSRSAADTGVGGGALIRTTVGDLTDTIRLCCPWR